MLIPVFICIEDINDMSDQQSRVPGHDIGTYESLVSISRFTIGLTQDLHVVASVLPQGPLYKNHKHTSLVSIKLTNLRW